MVENDPSVHMVLMEGAGDKAFCAGGDIVGKYSCRGDYIGSHGVGVVLMRLFIGCCSGHGGRKSWRKFGSRIFPA